jgi:hypothetical protein
MRAEELLPDICYHSIPEAWLILSVPFITVVIIVAVIKAATLRVLLYLIALEMQDP